MEKLFTGIYPPIITPFTADGNVDYEAIKFNIKKWNESKLSGYIVLGSNGEYIYLDYEEKLKIIRLVVENAADGKKVVAGTGCESTKETIKLSREAGVLGVNGVLVINPFYYGGAMTGSILLNHYRQVADNIEVPLLLYNVPKFTGLNMDAGLVAQLSEHPNIVGIKDSTGNVAQLGEIISQTGEDFNVLVGTASVLSSAIALGAVGGILALANIAPDHSVKIMKLVKAGKYEQARQLQLRMIPVNKVVTATYGIAGLKCALNHLGYRGGFPRLPLKPLDKEKEIALLDILQKGGLL